MLSHDEPSGSSLGRDLQETTPSASKCTRPRSGETEGVSKTHMGLVAKDRPKDCGSKEAVSDSTWTSLSNLALEFGEMGVQIVSLPADTPVFRLFGCATGSLRDGCRICRVGLSCQYC